jgi:NAD+ diphosphatase
MSSSVADIPAPAHVEFDSMLSRKFGKETVNYFSGNDLSVFLDVRMHAVLQSNADIPTPGSPLNRVSFLRTDSHFLSSALKHPGSRFLLFNQLAPLVRTPSEIFFASYGDVASLIPADIFDKSEEEVLREYNSSITIPQLVFLGLHESQTENALSYKSYTGTAYFALDITPRGTIEQQANSVVAAMEAKGLSFHQVRIVTALSADVGMYCTRRAIAVLQQLHLPPLPFWQN